MGKEMADVLGAVVHITETDASGFTLPSLSSELRFSFASTSACFEA